MAGRPTSARWRGTWARCSACSPKSPSTRTNGQGFRSSVRVTNLVDLENLLSKLHSPRWPAYLLGPPKGDVKRGAELFHKRKLKDYSRSGDATATCAQCHHRLRSDDTRSEIKAQMQPVTEAGTDMWSACNAVAHKANAGNMTGRFENGLAAGDSEVESTRLHHQAAEERDHRVRRLQIRRGLCRPLEELGRRSTKWPRRGPHPPFRPTPRAARPQFPLRPRSGSGADSSALAPASATGLRPGFSCATKPGP